MMGFDAMPDNPPDETPWNLRLSQALRAVRRGRGMKARDVARAMHMPLRSYEYFEAGGGDRLNLERVQAFAAATQSDPHAILAGAAIGSAQFALRAADNKLMAAFLMILREFDQALGDDIEALETGLIISRFTEAFDALSREGRQKASSQDAWRVRSLKGIDSPVPPKPEPDDDD